MDFWVAALGCVIKGVIETTSALVPMQREEGIT